MHWFQAPSVSELWLRAESSPRSAPVLALSRAFPAATTLVIRVDKYGVDDAYDALVRTDAWHALHAPVFHVAYCPMGLKTSMAGVCSPPIFK